MGANHHHSKSTPLKALLIAISLVFSFGVIEAIAGSLSNSLALLGDAGHMASDAVALIIAAFAAWVAMKPPSSKHSYGYGRAEVIAAWFSSLLLLSISIVVIVKAVTRLHHPPEKIDGMTVILISIIGILVNLVVAWILSRSKKNLNTRAALLHVFSDLLASFAALFSGAVIYCTNWLFIDPLLSMAIGVLILISSIRLLRESLRILMEGVPQHIDIQQVKQHLCEITSVENVHDLHIWTLSSGRVALSAHIHIHDLGQWPQVFTNTQSLLADKYHIKHITLQPEPDVLDCQSCNG